MSRITRESQHQQSKSKECGCKGVRSCLLCQGSQTPDLTSHANGARQVTYVFCASCQRAVLGNVYWETQLEGPSTTEKDQMSPQVFSCTHNDLGAAALEFPGINVIDSFVTKEEEKRLDEAIYNTPFTLSQSGRQKQDFGPKVNFKKQKLKTGVFNGLPSYSLFLYQRMKTYKLLEDFEPVEMCNLEYSSDRGAHIDPHMDDTWVWGDRLVTLNLVSDSILTFTHPSITDTLVQVPMAQRSLLVVSGPARYNWKHAIEARHIHGRRIAMTFRELANEFMDGERRQEGRALLDVALTFQGAAVGSAEIS